MSSDDLSRAARLFHKQRYTNVIRLLEPNIFLYRENAQYYYFIGMSCLHSGDVGGADSYLQRCIQIEPEHINGQLGLAAVQLKRRKISEALKIWLHILEIDPKNSRARRALALVRRSDGTSGIYSTIRSKGLKMITGERTIALARIGRMLFVLALICGIGALATVGILRFIYREPPRAPRGGVEHIRFAAQVEELFAYEGSFRYIMTEDEIRATLRSIEDHFQDFRDNLAMREINRLLHANASNEIKRRAQILSEYFARPDFTNFQDNFQSSEVLREPWLYNGCYVRWKGRIANLQNDETRNLFDFLVGYQDEQTLELVIPVVLRFPAQLANGMSIEIIGRIESDERLLRIESTTIRPLEG